MCGLTGFSAPKDKSFNLDKIKLLMMMNQERGKDSYGYYTIPTGVIKDTGKVEDAMTKPSFTIPESNLLIGHVRSSTVGSTNKTNAHPFECGNVVLAMNGTLDNHWDLCRDAGFSIVDFDVDSHVLTAILNKDQHSGVLGKVIGGCAVLYTDTTNNKMYAYRNIGRPLFRGNLNECMYISSIESSLKIIGCSDVKEFKENVLYEIIDGKIANNFKIKQTWEEAKPTTIIENNRIKIKLNFSTMRSSELVGMWLQPQHTTYLPNGGEFKAGHAYEVVGSSEANVYDIAIMDHNGLRKIVSKFTFKEEQPVLLVDDYIFATKDITYAKTKKNKNPGKFAEAGHMLRILGVAKEGWLAKNLLTDAEAIVYQSMIRYAHPKESEDFFKFYYPEENTTTQSSNQEWLASLQLQLPDPRTVNNGCQVRFTEEEIFKAEVDAQHMSSYDQLVDFTVDNIKDLIIELMEQRLATKATIKVNNISVLLDNFDKKSIELFKKATINAN